MVNKGIIYPQKQWRELCLLTYCLKVYEQLINDVLHLLLNSDHSQHPTGRQKHERTALSIETPDSKWYEQITLEKRIGF